MSVTLGVPLGPSRKHETIQWRKHERCENTMTKRR